MKVARNLRQREIIASDCCQGGQPRYVDVLELADTDLPWLAGAERSPNPVLVF
jgi:hypothetical protein